MNFIESFIDSAPILVEAMWKTLALTGLTLVFAVFLGGVLTAMKLSKVKVVNWIAVTYLAVVRGMPLVALLFVIYFGIVAVVRVDAFTAAVIGLSVHSSAYVAEIFRSGISSVGRGQIEASRSLGLGRAATMRKVVLPQAIKVVVPALANQAILSLKESAVAAFITVDELFLAAQQLAASTYQPLMYYVIVSLYYLAIVGIMTLVATRIEVYFKKRG